MKRPLMIVLGIASFQGIRFKFNLWSSRTEFNIVVNRRWCTDAQAKQAEQVIQNVLSEYLNAKSMVMKCYSDSISKTQFERVRLEMDDAAHQYVALLRLARYFRPDYFVGYPDVRTSSALIRRRQKRPYMPMGFIEA